jgi:hypothetical protein
MAAAPDKPGAPADRNDVSVSRALNAPGAAMAADKSAVDAVNRPAAQ